jgi:photosystem II stability/assembly factor-like uncharacterized protein
VLSQVPSSHILQAPSPTSDRCFTIDRVRLLTFVLLALVVGEPALWTQVQSTGFNSNLRGLSVSQMSAGKSVVWASGTNGIVLRSLDEGETWQQLKIDGETDLDFRDIEAFDANTAYLMSSGDGEKSRIYKTTDGGKTWVLQYTGKRPGFFLDSLACDSKTHCFALSDPVDGKFVVLATTDGQHWKELPRDKMPTALSNEGAFAASGTSIALCNNDIYFGTGGPMARVFHSTDRGRSWFAIETPIISGNASSGIFSVACHDNHVVVVGGDYKNPERAERVAAYSKDRGKTWHLSDYPPRGYRSSVCLTAGTSFAVGPNGEDTSLDYGANWKSAGNFSLNSATITAGGIRWTVGPGGTFHQFR